jgi:hypothetical protein
LKRDGHTVHAAEVRSQDFVTRERHLERRLEQLSLQISLDEDRAF